MSVVAVAVIGGAIIGGVATASAGDDAADAQVEAADKGIGEQRRQFDAIRKLLAPYTNAGAGALTAQQDLIGLNGPEASARAIAALRDSPQFQSAQQAGVDSILSNASATGGLRGGNVQSALGQFSPALLSSIINDQYARLGGITSIGQNAAAGVGNAGMNSANQVSALLQQQGAATAGAALNQGRAFAGVTNGVAQGFGYRYGMQQPVSTAPTTNWVAGSGDGFVTNPQYGF